MANIIIEAARALVIRETRIMRDDVSTRNKIEEILDLVLQGLTDGKITIVDDKIIAGARCCIGEHSFCLADVTAQRYFSTRTLADIVADVAMGIVGFFYLQYKKNEDVGNWFIAELKGAN